MTETQTITLASGRVVTVRPGIGADIVKAQMMVRTPEEMTLALLSLLVEIDGQRVTLEDLLAMPLDDVFELLPLVGRSRRTPPASSSASAGSAGGTTAS